MTTKDEDQDWLDALAGKPNPNADPAVTSRATLLHHAIKKRDAELGVNNFDVESELQKLKFRMRREGITGGEGKSQLFSYRFLQYATAASIILTVGLSVRLYTQEPTITQTAMLLSEKQIVLGNEDKTRIQQLTAQLDELNIKYQLEQQNGKLLLHANGVEPVKENVDKFLAHNEVEPPKNIDSALSSTVGICINPDMCGSKGFICKSKLDDLQEEYNLQKNKYTELLETNKDLMQEVEKLKRELAAKTAPPDH